MDRRIEQIKEAVVNGKHKEIVGLVETAIGEQIELNSIINEGLIGGMDIPAGCLA
jgi:methanogenic corrinoid protein MtbC1